MDESVEHNPTPGIKENPDLQRQAFEVLNEFFPGENGGKGEFQAMAGWIMEDTKERQETVVLKPQDTTDRETYPELSVTIPDPNSPDFSVKLEQKALSEEHDGLLFTVEYRQHGENQETVISAEMAGSATSQLDASLVINGAGDIKSVTRRVGGTEHTYTPEDSAQYNSGVGFLAEKWRENGIQLNLERTEQGQPKNIQLDPITSIRNSTLALKNKSSDSPIINHV